MSDNVGAQPVGVKRVVYKQIVEGDFRKFVADSNDSPSGGGARDLRFRPYDEFEKIFRHLFPNVRKVRRRRGGAQMDVRILVGRLYWSDNVHVESKEATFEPPTDARPNEGRLPIVHTYPPFNTLPPTNEGRMVLMLIQREDDTVWPAFATEDSLRSGAWQESVASPILKALDDKAGTDQVARGYLDLTNKEVFDA